MECSGMEPRTAYFLRRNKGRKYLDKFKPQKFHCVNNFFQRCVPVASPKKEGLLQVPNVHHRVYRKEEDGELVIATLQNQINLNGVLNVSLVQVLFRKYAFKHFHIDYDQVH